MADSLAKTIRSRKPLIGNWLQIPHPMVAETLAQSGADFILLDGEHAPLPPDALITLLPAIERYRMPVLYRVRINATELIKGALDAGVSGVMVPMVNSVEEAQAVIAAAKFPPMGKRGVGPWRAANYYLDDNYLAAANTDVAVVLQIETKEAVEAVDEIARIKGVDALFVGPFDLCMSMGLEPGKLHPELITVYTRVNRAARRTSIATAIDVGSLDFIAPYRELGFSLMTHGLDTQFLIDGSRQVVKSFKTAFAG
jgi:4-hydroxy-2-oxoheptanedioate aldolase